MNYWNNGNNMSLKLFNIGHALPLRSRRILPPPNLRRFSGGNAAGSLPGIHCHRHGMDGGISAGHPPEHLTKLPDKFPAITRMVLNCSRSIAQQTAETMPQHWRRTFNGIASAIAGQFPITVPSYARH